MTAFSLDDACIAYSGNQVVHDVSLSLGEGRLLALLGPSGCGKSTLLRAVAGLLPLSSGRIVFGDRDVTRTAPRHRNVGLVFQDHLLFPHLTLLENVAYGLRSRRAPGAKARALEMLDLVGLAHRKDDHPSDLSGGQSQRVALARALAVDPAVLLLDEPFSALDVDLRAAMREEVRRIVTEAGATTIMVTHDREEAMDIADEVALLSDGRLVEHGTVRDLYESPENPYTASFFSRSNLLPAVATASGQASVLGWRTPVRGSAAGVGPATVAVRPEAFAVGAVASGIPAVLESVKWMGDRVATRWRAVDESDLTLRVSLTSEPSVEVGQMAGLSFAEKDAVRVA
ncbi:ABC transporter ATP-binding protein [Microbacterium sp. NPDC077663]|uniref:ABC transporter ATP-binding protein n=1 Tax=Microbacterium sp. NPDC077663 TaxID=3364189 RepID=UPI0037CBF8B6